MPSALPVGERLKIKILDKLNIPRWNKIILIRVTFHDVDNDKQGINKELDDYKVTVLQLNSTKHLTCTKKRKKLPFFFFFLIRTIFYPSLPANLRILQLFSSVTDFRFYHLNLISCQVENIKFLLLNPELKESEMEDGIL